MRTSASEDDAIRNQRDGWKAAFESGDVDRVISYYAPGSATRVFDISPPLQFDGYDACQRGWGTFLQLFRGTPHVETREVRIEASGELGLVHGLVHLTGTAADGAPFDLWIRATHGLHKIGRTWLVTHDHVSVPVDLHAARAPMDPMAAAAAAAPKHLLLTNVPDERRCDVV